MDGLLGFVARTAVHSTVAAAVSELVIVGLGVAEPLGRYRLRVLAVLVPPLTAALAPSLTAAGWPALLHLEPWRMLQIGPVRITHLAEALFGAMALIFVVQELVPWLRQRRRAPAAQGSQRPRRVDLATLPRLAAALGEVFGAPPACYRLETTAHTLSVREIEGRDALVFGADFPDWLDDLELRAVLAHERAHVLRQDLRTRSWLYAFRVVQLHAPFALVEYRQLVHDSEEVCDAMAVDATGAPLALASGLLKAHGGGPSTGEGLGLLARTARRVERHAGSVRLRRRVRRLLDRAPAQGPGSWTAWATALALAALLLGVA